jgi:hypothetical protein
VSHKTYKVGDLVRLDPEKYNEFTARMLGVVSEVDETYDWAILSVSWIGDREATGHLPNDLNLVQ